ncbi:hypothetical protein DKX38_024451 [Salix brachista]|uniref:Uncharacterized protein n=1 Tax=Salix brachista TaxID=2182728 RepID=A0A5N5JM91_9ROSI|nr:hypothetical protein DKX38_024451 [Salix brachista]
MARQNPTARGNQARLHQVSTANRAALLLVPCLSQASLALSCGWTLLFLLTKWQEILSPKVGKTQVREVQIVFRKKLMVMVSDCAQLRYRVEVARLRKKVQKLNLAPHGYLCELRIHKMVFFLHKRYGMVFGNGDMLRKNVISVSLSLRGLIM